MSVEQQLVRDARTLADRLEDRHVDPAAVSMLRRLAEVVEKHDVKHLISGHLLRRAL